MLGDILRTARENKGFKIKEVSDGIIHPSQLSKIENTEVMPSFENFLKLLSKLNLSFEEFSYLAKENPAFQRRVLDQDVTEALRQKDTDKMNRMMERLKKFQREAPENHLYSQQMMQLLEGIAALQNKDQEEARLIVKEIVDYLNRVEPWYHYELKLFNDIFFYFEYETVLALGREAQRAIELRYDFFRNDPLPRKILYNLSVAALHHEDYMRAFKFSSDVIGLPLSTENLYTLTNAKIVNQLASFKLENGLFDLEQLQQLLAIYDTLGISHVAQQFRKTAQNLGVQVNDNKNGNSPDYSQGSQKN